MKIRVLLVSLLLICGLTGHAQSLRIATYNVRFANPADSGNLWMDRAPVVINLIRYHDFDVFGTQEALKSQLDDLSKALPQYGRYGKGRSDGKEGGEFSAIFYKKDRFKLLQKGDYWLSETPDKPSLGWDATCCNRISSWVQLQDVKNSRRFFVFNAHFDHQGTVARLESAKLMLKKIREIAGNAPVVLTGDFNGDHKSEWYQILANSSQLKDTYKLVKYPYANNSSFNAFGANFNSAGIIDHIFISDHFKALKWGLLTDTYHGKYPSDHFPVVADLDWK